MGKYVEEPYMDPIIKGELMKIQKKVTKKDKDWFVVIDGQEGSGKSTLAMQVAKTLDPKFGLDDIFFNGHDLEDAARDPKGRDNRALVLDEAFLAANSRSAMSDMNKKLIGLATEVRQRNYFFIIVLPSFFDLDRYFALWRCRALFHVYLDKNDESHFIVFPQEQKKLLYLTGKKTYSYKYPRSPFPPFKFLNQYVVDEQEYRKKKSDAFHKKPKKVLNKLEERHVAQRDALATHLYNELNYTSTKINEVLESYGSAPIVKQSISEFAKILKEFKGKKQKAKEMGVKVR